MLDAVDAGPDQPGQRVLAEHVGRDPRALGVRGVHGRLAARRRATAARGRPPRARSSRRRASPTGWRGPARRPAPAAPPGSPPRSAGRGCSAWAGRGGARPGRSRASAGRRRAGGCRPGLPQSRRSSAPAAASVCPCSRASSRSTGPSGPMPTWQWASTRPGRIQAPSATVGASGTGSRLIRPSAVTHSSPTRSPSAVPSSSDAAQVQGSRRGRRRHAGEGSDARTAAWVGRSRAVCSAVSGTTSRRRWAPWTP